MTTDGDDRIDPRDDDRTEAGGSSGSSGSSGETWRVSRSGPNPRIVLAIVLAIVLVVFAALNFNPVRVNFLVFTTRARVVTVIVVAAALGFVVGWFVGRPAREERRHLREWRSAPRRDDREG